MRADVGEVDEGHCVVGAVRDGLSCVGGWWAVMAWVAWVVCAVCAVCTVEGVLCVGGLGVVMWRPRAQC